MARRLSAPILEPPPAAGLAAPAQERLSLDLTQARAALHRNADCYLPWSERIAVPLALLDRRTPQAPLLHAVESTSKQRAIRVSGLGRRVRMAGVFSAHQAELAATRCGISSERISIVPYGVDERFFVPQADAPPGDYVLAVGREQRDWGTLGRALSDRFVRCVAVGSSPWSRRTLSGLDADVFDVRSELSYVELRALYASARAVIIPILPGVQYSAGLTSLREAQAMGRPTIVSDVVGLRGLAPDDTAVRVTPGDPLALREQIQAILGDTALSRRIADAGRACGRAHTLERYVEHVAGMVAG